MKHKPKDKINTQTVENVDWEMCQTKYYYILELYLS